MTTKQISYIPSLDGIRAVAVMLVFLAHSGYQLIPGGFGVTIFFFLSGFLITTLMRKEYEKRGTISIKHFYIRRVYRIFPALYIVILISMLYSFLSKATPGLELLPVLSQILHFTNYYFIFIGPDGFAPGLVVLWSLAVEEHFYFFFPLFFTLLIGNGRISRIVIGLVIICIIVLIWRYFLVSGHNVSEIRTYYATDTRLDSIGYGCIMALIMNPFYQQDVFKTKTVELLVIAFSVATLIFTFVYREPTFRETYRYSVQGIALFPLFYLAIKEYRSILFSWLNLKPLIFFGKISFVFYLSHSLVITILESHFSFQREVQFLIALIITTLFSALIHFQVEKKFALLRKKLHD